MSRVATTGPRTSKAPWLSAAFLVAAVPLFAQLPFSHPELGLAVTLPPEFMREGEDLLASPTTIACWIAPSVAGQRGWVRLCVERLKGTLERQRSGRSDLPAGAAPVTFAWKGFDLEGAMVRSQADGEEIAVFVALVPLRKAAIRLVASAPQADRAHAQSALVATLATLQGETNWLPSTERASRAGEMVGRIGVIILAVGAGMWIMQRRQRQKTASQRS